MTEIFDNIPMSVKMDTELAFRTAIMQHNINTAAKMLNVYVDSCQNEEEKEFANFYFQMKFEELLNDDTTNLR